MPIGDKAFEEKSKSLTPFIKSANTKERSSLTFCSEVVGFGRWPNGTIIASGEERIGADGKAKSEWHGLWSTREGDFIRWTGSDRTTGLGQDDKGVSSCISIPPLRG